MKYPIYDLHCDLLSFLVSNPEKTEESPESNTSYLQMKRGGLVFETLTLFTETCRDAHRDVKAQLKKLSKLLATRKYTPWNPCSENPLSFKSPIAVALAFENAHSLCLPDEPISKALAFLESVAQRFTLLYISLTWDLENRYGGGCGSNVGLKKDGEKLLCYLSGKNIAVDFSHASDALANDILEYIEKHSLDVAVIASHSNFRKITHQERNLPDSIAREIIKRKGLIGLNLFAPFVGKSLNQVTNHLEHLLHLGGEDCMCFGADFFRLSDLGYLEKKYGIKEGFFSEFSNSSCYPEVLALIGETMNWPHERIEKLASKNAIQFLEKFSI